jgi:quercetin dioxygenase-like cupin family protein
MAGTTEKLEAEQAWQAAEPGVRRRIRVDGEKLMLVEVHFIAGAKGNLHSHPHEQSTYVLKGRVLFSLNGKEYEFTVGDSLLIPPGVMHGAEALEETLLLDVFSPPRQDFRYSIIA